MIQESLVIDAQNCSILVNFVNSFLCYGNIDLKY